PVPLGVRALHRVRPARPRREADRRRAAGPAPRVRENFPGAGRRAAQLHAPRLPEPQHHGDRRGRAGGDRFPGRAAGTAAVRPGGAVARQLRRARSAADRSHAAPLSGDPAAGGRAFAAARGVHRLLRSAHRAAQAEGRGAIRLHRSGEEEPGVPGAHPVLAALRARRFEAAARAARSAGDSHQARSGAAGVSRIVAVLPFAAEVVDPDAYDLARWLAADVAAELSVPSVIEARLVVDVVEISPYALGEAATQLKAEAALGATLHLAEGVVSLAAMLAGPDGKLRAQWAESLPLGAATRLPRMLARATLLALGEDASAPAQSVEPEAPGEAVLRLCRAAVGGDRMPAFFSAIERLAEARPDDAEVLLALGDYR